MKRKLKSDRGFTLAELLIVVAIIGVLVAIAIPIFTSQLERSREAVDLSDVRSAYAEVMMAAITGDTSATYTKDSGQKIYKETDGTYSIMVTPLKQQKDDWQTPLPITIGGVSSSASEPYWVGVPGAGGSCKIIYHPPTSTGDEYVSFYWTVGKDNESSGNKPENGDRSSGGATEGGSTEGGSTEGGSGDSSNENSTNHTWPNFSINNITPFIPKSGVSVTAGNVYSYNGKYYVCTDTRSADSSWRDFNGIVPDKNDTWLYVQLVDSPTVLTPKDLDYSDPNQLHFNGASRGTIYKDYNNKLYILKADYNNQNWCTPPESGNTNWQIITQ